MASARGRTAASAAGQLLVTVGVLLLLFAAYELWGTALVAARGQAALDRQLDRTWAQPAPAPTGPGPLPAVDVPQVPVGSAWARLYLPTLTTSSLAVVEGVGAGDLRRGPGHLPGSAAPGQAGNLVLSGHRTTYGAPFADLDRLRPGDPVVLQTRDGWATYRVTGEQTVRPSAVGVTLPVPDAPGAAPSRSLLTLTTCTPRYSASHRLVVRAELETAGPDRPDVLAG